MRRILQLSCLLGAFALSINAAAQAPAGTPATGDQTAAPAAAGTGATATGTAAVSLTAEPAATAETTPPPPPPVDAPPPPPAAEPPAPPPPPPPAEPTGILEGWQTVFTGYFRTPMILTLSSRRYPGDSTGDKSTQVVMGTKRLVDGGYDSFPYTRLNEGDWAEIYLTEKRKHVAATVVFEGGLYGEAASFVGPNERMTLGQGWIALDTDVDLGGFKPWVELKMGAWWNKFGNIDKYDTYLFARTHVMGEALRIDFPVTPDLTFKIVDGFGANRAASETSTATGTTLLHYLHLGGNYKKMLTVGLNYNDSWTKDPSIFENGTAYAEAKKADMTVLGADVDVNLPVAGHLWLALSYIDLVNGLALSGTHEIMHSFGGSGIAKNYMGGTGTGSMINFAFLYENSLSILQGKSRGAILPDATLNLFGMMANVSPDGGEKYTQFKWGADVKVDTLSWLAFMLRYDWVNTNMDADGQVFGVLTPRVIFSSNFLSNETIYLQYSRYFYGDAVAISSGGYTRPDNNVIKMQATIGW